eukprot:jgi/Psemu1/6930/gm1.6930_g
MLVTLSFPCYHEGKDNTIIAKAISLKPSQVSKAFAIEYRPTSKLSELKEPFFNNLAELIPEMARDMDESKLVGRKVEPFQGKFLGYVQQFNGKTRQFTARYYMVGVKNGEPEGFTKLEMQNFFKLDDEDLGDDDARVDIMEEEESLESAGRDDSEEEGEEEDDE